MGKMGKCLYFMLIFVFSTVASGWAQTPNRESGEGVLVGRISHVEGQLLRYVPEEKDWVATVKDAPFGLDDSLYSETRSKAEFIMPNSTWIRVGGSTQLQLIGLRSDLTEIDAASGMVRFYSRNSEGLIKATSPFGYVVAPANTVFDLYVGDRSLEVIALKGTVSFVLDVDQSKYEVTAGGSSIVSDGRQVTSGQGNVDAEWDDWNSQRDQLWTKRTEVKGDSVRYLPSNLRDDSYALDENGRWERVYYEGQYRWFWRPVHVSAGWAPFTVGRWTVYYGDNCWIPYEPFGYVTHHYGNWVYAGNFWYWAPPVVSVGVSFGPFLGIGYGWYPGRVGWIYSGSNVGWVPLAPFEPYYCRRWWGPRNVVVNNVYVNNININRYQYINRAVIVNQRNLYSVNNYQNVRIPNVTRNTIINNYRAVPVINDRVINNYSTMRDRYRYTDARVDQRPHDSVLNRISHNEQLARTARSTNARVIEREVAAFQHGRPQPEAKIEAPRVTDRLVRQQDAGRPVNDLQLPQREVRERSKPPTPIASGVSPQVQGQSGRTAMDRPSGDTGRGRTFSGEGQVMRPPVSTGDAQAAPSGTPRTTGGEGQRFRPPRPGQSQPTADPGQRQLSGDQEMRGRQTTSGGGSQPVESGTLKSPLEGNRKVRQPKPQQDVQPPDSVDGRVPTAKSPEQGQRSRTVPSGSSISQSDQTGQAGQQPSEPRQRVRAPSSGRTIQGSPPTEGAVQAPSGGSQRSGQSGSGREVRQRDSRPAALPVEQPGNAVMPREQPQPRQRAMPAAPSPQRQPQQLRSPQQDQHQSAGIPQEQAQPQRPMMPAPPSTQPQTRQPRSHPQAESATQAVEQSSPGGMAAPQAPSFDSGSRGGGHGQKSGFGEGTGRGKGRGAGND